MTTLVYANRIGNIPSAVYHKVHSIKEIISNPSSERIIFNTGEIELSTSQNGLTICSKTYLPNGKSLVTNKIVKNLIPGYNPQLALNRAKIDILQRVTDLEMRVRETEICNEMRKRIIVQYSDVQRQEQKGSLFDTQKLADQFLQGANKAS